MFVVLIHAFPSSDLSVYAPQGEGTALSPIFFDRAQTRGMIHKMFLKGVGSCMKPPVLYSGAKPRAQGLFYNVSSLRQCLEADDDAEIVSFGTAADILKGPTKNLMLSPMTKRLRQPWPTMADYG